MSNPIIVYGAQQVAYADPDVTQAQRDTWALDDVQCGLHSPFLGDIPHERRLAQAMTAAHTWGYQQLWFTLACPYRLTEAALAYARGVGWRFSVGGDRPVTEQSTWILAMHSNGRARVTLMFLGQDDLRTWGAAGDAWELWHAINAYHDATGAWWQWSSGGMGQRLMRAAHSGPGATSLDLPYGAPPPAQVAGHGDGAYNWSRKLRPEELRGKVINSFDINGQYLAACSSLALGVGEWRRAATHSDAELVPRDAPGYWRVSIPSAGATPLGIPIVDGRPLLRNADYTQAWIATPTMQLLREMNVAYWLDECYYWPEHRHYLTPWYKRLRDARATLMEPGDGHTVALSAVKDNYAVGIAWLNLHQRSRPDALQRPDWRDAIISQARANQWRALWRVYAATHLAPFALGADCAYYLGDPDGLLPPLRTGTGLGAWKRKDIAVSAEEPTIARILTSGLSGPYRVKLLQASLNALRDGRDPERIWDRYIVKHVQMAEVTGDYAHVS